MTKKWLKLQLDFTRLKKYLLYWQLVFHLDVFGGGSFVGKNTLLHQVDERLIRFSDFSHSNIEFTDDQRKFGTLSFEQSNFFAPTQFRQIELNVFEIFINVFFGLARVRRLFLFARRPENVEKEIFVGQILKLLLLEKSTLFLFSFGFVLNGKGNFSNLTQK